MLRLLEYLMPLLGYAFSGESQNGRVMWSGADRCS